jgi:hypothetical protein
MAKGSRNEMRTRLVLDGEKQYNAALDSADRHLKSLRSALKAETAELGANATAQQKNELKVKSLQKQIAEQEKVVETLRKALDEAKTKYGDNEEVVAKWEQKLNYARATLANMSNELGTLENGMRGASDATAEGVTASKSFADAVQNIASIGDSVSGALEGIFTGLVDTVRDTVEQLWDFIGQTAEKANQWTDIAGYWNTDPGKVQQWARAVGASANSFSDFQQIVSKINIGGKQKAITELLGVSDVNYKDQWDYAIAVMDRLYELRQSGQNMDNIWETIFGEKKATKAMDVLNDWESIKGYLDDFDADKGGFGYDSETMATLNDVWVQMNEIDEKWKAIKESVAGGLAPIAADLMINVTGSLDALNAFMKADTKEEQDAALEEMKKNIQQFFAKVRQAIEQALILLKDIGSDWADDDDPVIAGIGKMLSGIADTLAWIEEHADLVGKALLGIFSIGLMAKLATIGFQITGMIAQLKVISAFNGLGAAAGGAGAAAGAGGAAAVGGGAGAAGGAAAAGGGGFLAAAAPWAALVATVTGIATTLDKEYVKRDFGEYNQKRDTYDDLLALDGSSAVTHLQDMLDAMVEGLEYSRNAGMDDDGLAGIKNAFRMYADEYLAADPDNVFFKRYAEQRGYLDDSHLDPVELTKIMDDYIGADEWYKLATDMTVAMSGAVEQEQQNPGSVDWLDYARIEDSITTGVANAYRDDDNKALMGELSDGLSGFKGLPGTIYSAVAKGVSNIKVYLDGTVVGNLVAPTVSYAIGGRAYPELR